MMQVDQTSQNSAACVPRHHEDLYFLDGDVILSVADGEDTVLFRLHRFMLSHHSPVFKDMFSFPTNPDINEMYDSVPVVRMPDEGEDLTRLVRALYNPETLELDHSDPEVPISVRPLLTLAKKYQVDSITTRIVRHIESDWPEDVWDFYEMQQAIETRATVLMDGIGDAKERAEMSFPEPASAIRLAMEFDIPSILPAAFYRLAVSEPGIRWGVIKSEFFDTYKLSAKWDVLADEDWRRYNVGKAALLSKSEELKSTFSYIAEKDFECESNARCRVIRRQLMSWHEEQMNVKFALQPGVINIVAPLLTDDDSLINTCCLVCMETMHHYLRKYMGDLWEELPEMFQL